MKQHNMSIKWAEKRQNQRHAWNKQTQKILVINTESKSELIHEITAK